MTKTELSHLAQTQIEVGRKLLEDDGLEAAVVNEIIHDTENAIETLIGCGNTLAAEQFIERVLPYFNSQLAHPVSIHSFSQQHN